MLNLSSIMVGSADPKKLGEFYQKVLGQKPTWEDGEWIGFQVGSCHLTIGPHSDIKGKSKEPARLMLNLETKNVKGEFERIQKLGAKVIAKPYTVEDMEGDIATFADPDGNYFQLMSPYEGQ